MFHATFLMFHELDGTDGDLLIVGALGMGISDEERMALIGDALRGELCTFPIPMLAGCLPRVRPMLHYATKRHNDRALCRFLAKKASSERS